MKTCTVCNENKELSEFYSDPLQSSKLRPNRISCVKKQRNFITNLVLRNSYYEKKYGISLGDYNFMLDAQGYKCAICQKHQSNFKRSLCVDHDHVTGKVRGLLCDLCNTAIGKLNDDARLLKRAALYIELG